MSQSKQKNTKNPPTEPKAQGSQSFQRKIHPLLHPRINSSPKQLLENLSGKAELKGNKIDMRSSWVSVKEVLNKHFSKKRFKNIKDLDLSLPDSTLSGQELRWLGKVIAKNFRALATLSVSTHRTRKYSSYAKDPSNRDFVFFSSLITQSLPKLKSFSLKLDVTAKVSESGFEHIYKDIGQRLKHLNQLTLNLENHTNRLPLGTNATHPLNTLRNFQKIRVKTERSVKKEFEDVANYMRRFASNINTLDMFFLGGDCFRWTVKDLQMSQAGPKQKQGALDLTILFVHVPGQVQILSNLGFLTHLEQLSLTFEDGVKFVQHAFMTCKSHPHNRLKKLNLKFESKAQLEKSHLENFCQNFLKNLHELSELNIKFIHFSLTNDNLGYLNKFILQTLKQLNSYSLSVTRSHEITDKIFPIFLESFKSLANPNLEKINFSFYDTEKMSEEAAEKFQASVKNLLSERQSFKFLFLNLGLDF